MEEMLDIYNEDLEIDGVKSRADVHKYGFKHKVVQCYIINEKNKEKWVYFQQRSFNKNNYPGFYDIACAGHIDSGEEPVISMVRELEEEVGLKVDKSQLIYAGRKLEMKNHDHILDDEICELFVLKIPSDDFKLGEEVEDMVKVSFEKYKNWINGDMDTLDVLSLKYNRSVELNEKNICEHIREYNKELMDTINKL